MAAVETEAVAFERGRKPRAGYVYLLEAPGGGAHKIGCSVNPSKRVQCMSMGEPVVQVYSADMFWLETYFHVAFYRCRIVKEWFKLTPEDVQRISLIVRLDPGGKAPAWLVTLFQEALDAGEFYPRGTKAVRVSAKIVDKLSEIVRMKAAMGQRFNPIAFIDKLIADPIHRLYQQTSDEFIEANAHILNKPEPPK